jgi:protein tyrosine/serine phosphatase
MPRPSRLLLLLLIPPAAALGLSELRDYMRFPRRFAEVEPRALYRGGMPTADNIRNLRQENGIRTVVNLTDEKNTAEEKAMVQTIQRLGLKFFRVKMPGDGMADFASLDMAADALANKDNWPVFFHCAAGKQRSNAALAAYRLKYCGYSLEKVFAELTGKYDLDTRTESALWEHIRRYSVWAAAHRPMPPIGATSGATVTTSPADVTH